MQTQVILILAAGASSRMRGGDKLLELAPNIPQLRRITKAALATGARVFVALDPDHTARADLLHDLDIDIVPVPDAARGMSASIRAGIAALPQGTAQVMIVPADMPELTEGDLKKVLILARALDEGTILRGTSITGKHGHPVVFPKSLFDDLRNMSGDRGAQAVVQAHRMQTHVIALPGNHALIDLDTPEDWAAWRAGSFVPK